MSSKDSSSRAPYHREEREDRDMKDEGRGRSSAREGESRKRRHSSGSSSGCLPPELSSLIQHP